eukprot:SAG31_NODE_27_length_32731_cov_1443.130393_5_plen_34_part_00
MRNRSPWNFVATETIRNFNSAGSKIIFDREFDE